MSFSASVKEELRSDLPKNPCCRRALLLGILFPRAEVSGERISFLIRGRELIDFVSHLVEEQFGRIPRLVKCRDTVATQALVFSSAQAAAKLNELRTAVLEESLVGRCGNCANFFLRGLFLSCGRISVTEQGYLLEFSCGEQRESLQAFLRFFALEAKKVDRRAEKLLYFRNSVTIEEFLTRVGAVQAVFGIMDRKIEADIRNNANRIANCDANNIGKSISVAHKQVEVIRRLVEENKISFLPQELVDTAYARLEHDDLSIAQLAQIMQPPMTKSGLNHRLRRIMDLAENLLEDKI